MTIALVCGGRNYGRVPFGCPRDQYREAAAKASKQIFVLRETLDHLLKDRGITAIINGGQTGADLHAHAWAEYRRIPSTKIKAEWKRYGRAAGPIRNGRMLELKPDFVVAFEGGDGTADMVKQARAAGVEVLDFRENGDG
jgi:hypothetical protein